MLRGLCLNVRGARRYATPTLELLEARDCPAAPVINTFTAVQALGTQVVLSGTISDESPGTVAVNFTGAAAGTAYADSTGHFSVTVNLAAIAAVYATATDAESLSSDTLNVTPANSAAQIVNFNAVQVEGPGNIWTFSGQVIDEYAPGLTVYLNGVDGLQNQPVTVDENGYFYFATSLPEGTYGTATATVTDWWGVVSEIKYAIVR